MAKPPTRSRKKKKPAAPPPITDSVRADASVLADALATGRRDEVREEVHAMLEIAIDEYLREFPKAEFSPDAIRCFFCSATRDDDKIDEHVEECGLRFLAGLRKPVAPPEHCEWCGRPSRNHVCLAKPT